MLSLSDWFYCYILVYLSLELANEFFPIINMHYVRVCFIPLAIIMIIINHLKQLSKKKDLDRLSDVLSSWVSGDLDHRITLIKKDGSVLSQVLAKANDLIDHVDALIRENRAANKAINAGSTYRKILLGGLDGVYKTLAIESNQVFDLIQNKSDNLNNIAGEVEKSIACIVDSVGDSSHKTQGLSTSIYQINKTIRISTELLSVANEEVAKTLEKIDFLSSYSQKIDSIISMIKDVTGKTSLLAINASVEASRAGEAGKGFAVVASEVRILAGETSKATAEITKQIDDIKRCVLGVVKSAECLHQVISDINNNMIEVTQVVKEQSSSVSLISVFMKEAENSVMSANRQVASVKNFSK
jgi:methyl-accepting chemotaxis protein